MMNTRLRVVKRNTKRVVCKIILRCKTQGLDLDSLEEKELKTRLLRIIIINRINTFYTLKHHRMIMSNIWYNNSTMLMLLLFFLHRPRCRHHTSSRLPTNDSCSMSLSIDLIVSIIASSKA